MPRSRPKSGARLATVAVALAVAAALATWLLSIGRHRGWWSADTAVVLLQVCFAAALIAMLIGLYARFRRRDGQLLAVAATLLGLAVSAFLAGEQLRWGSHPPLHDVTTNLDDPPAFAALTIRRDLLAGVPVHDRPGYASLTPVERWKAVHAEAYQDLRPIAADLRAAEAIRRAEAIARRRGWAVVRTDLVGGSLEATATSRFLGFKDDIAVRAREEVGGGSIVDVRSVAREGVSDHGRGAAHIRVLARGLAPPS